MSLFKPNKWWELTEAKAKRKVQYLVVDNKSIFYPVIKCNFVLKRHSQTLVAMLILPGAVLAGLTLMVFWMNTMYTTRIAVAATVLLSDVFYCILLGVILPSNGDRAPVIVTFFRDSLLIASFSIIITTFVRYLRLKTGPPPHWMSDTVSKMESIGVVRAIFLGESSVEEEDAVEIIENGKKKKSSVWYQVATFVDRISFILFSFIYFILLLFYLP